MCDIDYMDIVDLIGWNNLNDTVAGKYLATICCNYCIFVHSYDMKWKTFHYMFHQVNSFVSLSPWF